MIIRGKKIDFATRLSDYLSIKGFSQAEFSTLTGYDDSQVSKWLSGKHEPYESTVNKINEKLDDFIDIIIGHPDKSANKYKLKEIDHSIVNDSGTLPVYDIYGRAGKSDFVNTIDNVEILGYIKVPGYENCLGWVKVKGDSMSPFLNSGDYIAIKRVDMKFIGWGNVYFIVFSGDLAPEPMVKYIRKGPDNQHLILRSHNEKYEDMEIPKASIKAVYAVRGGVIEIQ